MGNPKISLVGKRFGRLIVLAEIGYIPSRGQVYYSCKCDCGNIVETSAACLRGGKTSCGCILSERRKAKKLREEKARAQRKLVKENLRNVRESKKCSFRTNYCKLSAGGLCCAYCGEKDSCNDRCANSPEKCGLAERTARAEKEYCIALSEGGKTLHGESLY